MKRNIPWSTPISVGAVTITGGATETKQDAVIAALALLSKEAKQDTQLTNDQTEIQRLGFNVWSKIPGNSVEFTYYTGVVAGNPSGNKNIQTAVYKTGAATIATETFTYDAADDVLTVTGT